MARTEQPGAAAHDRAAPQDGSAPRRRRRDGPVMTPVVSELADRAEITSLVSRYFSAIDDKRLDRATMEAVFTASGRLTRPNGASLAGPDAIAASHLSREMSIQAARTSGAVS